MALRNLTSMFAVCRLTPISPFLPCVTSRQLNLPPSIPQQIMHQHKYEPYKTPEHHNSPEHMRLLKQELLDYPPYQNRKSRLHFLPLIYPFQFDTVFRMLSWFVTTNAVWLPPILHNFEFDSMPSEKIIFFHRIFGYFFSYFITCFFQTRYH